MRRPVSYTHLDVYKRQAYASDEAAISHQKRKKKEAARKRENIHVEGEKQEELALQKRKRRRAREAARERKNGVVMLYSGSVQVSVSS